MDGMLVDAMVGEGEGWMALEEVCIHLGNLLGGMVGGAFLSFG